jgi:hypothetical protein
MRSLILSIILLILYLTLSFSMMAQTWAPIGATWHYTKSFEYPPYLYSYLKIVSEKDTVINSINCRKMLRYLPGPTGTPNTYVYNLYMYEQGRKIYYYVSSLNRFCLLYDFNANAGDWWILDEYPASWGDTVKVISTSTININGNTRKTMVLDNTCFQYVFSGLTIEGIGNWSYMFPTFDMNTYGPLRCYQDNIIGLYTTGVTPSCETTNVGITGYNEKDFSMAPNPASNFLHITVFQSMKDAVLNIIDTKGVQYLSIPLSGNSQTIDLSSLPAGLYFIRLQKDGLSYYEKLMISR